MSVSRIYELFRSLFSVDVKEWQSVRNELLALAEQLDKPDVFFPYLNSESYQVRTVAVDALGLFKDDRCVESLVKLLDTEDDKQVQMAIVYALRNIATMTSLQALTKIANSKDYALVVQSLAIQSLAVSISDVLLKPLLALLISPEPTEPFELIESVFDAFKIVDDSVPDRLLEMLLLKDTPNELSLYIIDYLGERRYAQAYDAIVALLESEDTDIQRASAKALGNLGLPAAIPQLENKLEHADEFVKFTVEQALRQLKSEL